MFFEGGFKDTESVFDSIRACVTVRCELTVIRLIQAVKGLLPKKDNSEFGSDIKNDVIDPKRRLARLHD